MATITERDERTVSRQLDAALTAYVAEFVSRNQAARIIKAALDRIGIGFSPVIDHLTFRTAGIDRRAEEFTKLGYALAETLSFQDWYAKVYRKPGYPPLFIDQAYTDERGRTSIIPEWVGRFGERTLHHVAIRVEDIEAAMERLKDMGVAFTGSIVGERGGPLRQVFTAPESVDGAAFSVVELTERHEGHLGFSPPQADSLMKATVAPLT